MVYNEGFMLLTLHILATTSGVAGTLAVPGGPWHLIFALG